MAEQDIFSLLGEDDSKMGSDMNDLNPTLEVSQDIQGTSGAASEQPEAPKQQQVTVAQNLLTGSDPMLSQGVGASVASQLTSVQVKQMNTPSNPMWGSAQQVSKPQTIILQQGRAGQPAKLMLSHHDYAISAQKPAKVGQQIQVQKQTVQSQLQQQQQIQQQKNIQQQLQLSQQQQQQIKQQLQQLQQKQLQIQQQQQLQQITQQKQTTQGGFQQLQGGQTITLAGLQPKTLQQSPAKIATVATGTPLSPQQQTIIRLPVSLAQQIQQQQQQSLHLTPSSTVQTVTLQSKPLASTTGSVGSPRFIITRQPTQAQQGNQPVTLQLQMQDLTSLQRNIGKLQTLPGGQVLRIQPAQQQQQGVQAVLQPQLTLTNVNNSGTKVAAVQQPPPPQRIITLSPQQAQQLVQRSQQSAGSVALSLVPQNVNTTTTPASTSGQVLRTIVLPQAQTSTATSVGQVLRTLVVPQSAASTGVVQSGSTAGVATQNLNLLASQAAGASSAAQFLQRIVVPQTLAVSTAQAAKPSLVTTKPSSSTGQVVQTLVMPQTSTIALTTQAATKTAVSTVNTPVAIPGLTPITASGLTSLAASTSTGTLSTTIVTTTTTPPKMQVVNTITSPVSTQQVAASSAITQAVATTATVKPAVSSILSPKSASQLVVGTIPSPKPAAQPVVSNIFSPKPATQPVVSTIPSPKPAAQPVVSAILSPKPAAQPVVSTILSPKPAAQPVVSTILSPKSAAQPVVSTILSPKSAAQQVVSTVLSPKSAATSSAASSVLQAATLQQTTASTVGVPKTTPSTQAPGGKITISAATAQMLAQKGIVLTRTPQGTFVAKIPQSMLLKAAAAQGQAAATAGKPSALSLLNKAQTSVLQGQSPTVSTAQATTILKTQPKAKSQPTILSKSKKGPKSPQPAVVASSAAQGSVPKLVFTLGGQQGQIATTTATTGAEQKPKMIISMKPGVSAADEVKKIGDELGKLQGQSKTPANLQKLKDLHTKLKQLQLTVQASAVAAKAKAEAAASASSKSSEDTDGDSKSPKDEKERKKLIKQRQLQEKANRIVAEAVAKAKASGLKDIPKIMINVNLPEVSEDDVQKPKKEKTKRSKPSRPKVSKPKRSKSPKPPKPPKEKKVPLLKKKPKKLPLAALNKLKKQRKKLMPGAEESEDSEFDETPPATPDAELNDLVEKRRSTRNTNKRKKYTEDYDFNITDDSSSSDDDGKVPKVKKERKEKVETTTVIAKETEDVDTNLEIDVETVEPTEQTKFFVENPDESQANIVERILARRTVKKPQLPGEAQVGEMEEFFVKYRSYSYLHCEWCSQDKLLKGDPRILQKIRRFRVKQHSNAQYLQDLEDEPFNPDYIEVERVIDKAISEDPDNPGKMVTHYLIKWRSLPYEDATWEVPGDVDVERIKMYEKHCKVPPHSERKRVARGKSGSWEKMAETKVYKNDNVLREYQLEGVNWLTFSWFNGQNCILADEMGLGKTIQAITFLEEVAGQGITGPFLVIAPLSTIANWQREFETWTDVNCVVYHGSSQSRHMIAEYEMYFKDDRGRIIPNIYKFQVLVTTYEIVLADCQELSEIEWRVVIIDEAHRLKNRNCKLLEGLKILDLEHRVLLTGTPLQNNVEELFSLLNFLEPIRFRSSAQFMEDFGDLKSESQVEKLQQILRPMMLRRLKEDVEKTLAPKEETIIEVELTNIQKKYYRAILERNFNFLNKGSNSTANLPNLMNTMMELRKCCNHPFLIQGAEEQIMLDFQDLPEDEMPFRHIRALVQSAGKMVLLDKLLPKLKEGGHKVLIFSQMIRCLDILEDYLIQKQ